MAEVGATPKPGLVDRCDSGAHADMNYATFEASTAAIVPYLTQMFEQGTTWESHDYNMLFEAIRLTGIEAEKAMFAATDGVNTHKGMIFSMGTIAAAAGLFYRRHEHFDAEKILMLAGYLCYDAVRKDFQQQGNPRRSAEGLSFDPHALSSGNADCLLCRPDRKRSLPGHTSDAHGQCR